MKKFDDAIWEKSMSEAEILASQNWGIDVIEEKLPDGITLFVARNLELERCIAQGETREEALEELKKATHVHLAACLYYNLPVPKPKIENQVIENTRSISSFTPILIFIPEGEYNITSKFNHGTNSQSYAFSDWLHPSTNIPHKMAESG
ncbi:MAG: type II toxin-antitoxin system HicB family antitoxin [Anaerolineaceae bacterium]|nr:type II toxin-antitoxin system HicB family antitoxin [Anaerolineaceae bacterium]